MWWMRKPRHREFTESAQGHTRSWPSQNSNLNPVVPKHRAESTEQPLQGTDLQWMTLDQTLQGCGSCIFTNVCLNSRAQHPAWHHAERRIPEVSYCVIRSPKDGWKEQTWGDRAVILGKKSAQERRFHWYQAEGRWPGAEGVPRFLMKDRFGTGHEGMEPGRGRPGGWTVGEKHRAGKWEAGVQAMTTVGLNSGLLPPRKGRQGGCDSQLELILLLCLVLNHAECQWLWNVWLSFCTRILNHVDGGQGCRQNLSRSHLRNSTKAL